MTLLHGDCLDVMATLDADSIDAIVTDPPYGLSFMGRGWDHGVPGEPFWRQALRIAKPGAHLLAFGGTRTYHRLACAIEDAGWEVRDCLVWAYASGFPKSLDVSKAIDKAAGAEREVVGEKAVTNISQGGFGKGSLVGGSVEAGVIPITAPKTPEAERWQGWGTALKPAWEPIILARKPLRGTVARNVTEYGTGALNIDGCRIGTDGGGTNCSHFPGPCMGHENHGRYAPTVHTRRPTAKLDAWENDANLCASCAVDAASRARPGTPATRASTTPKPVGLLPNDSATSTDTDKAGTGCSDGTTEAATATSSSTAESGSSTTAPSPTGTSSTTSTRTRATTGSRTCISCGDPITRTTTSATPSDTATGRPAPTTSENSASVGRWPSNVLLTDPIFDGDTPGVVGGGAAIAGVAVRRNVGKSGGNFPFGAANADMRVDVGYGDTGTYSRFFLIPKAARSDREPVLGGLPERTAADITGRTEGSPGLVMDRGDGTTRANPYAGTSGQNPRANHHPTVKPTDLMRHLVRLVTPPGGTVLDPFLGSGTTALAAELEGFGWIGIEKEEEYVRIAEARLNGTQKGLGL